MNISINLLVRNKYGRVAREFSYFHFVLIFFSDFDECKEEAGTFCHTKATCINFPSNFSFGCTCGYGYHGNGTICTVTIINSGNYSMLYL